MQCKLDQAEDMRMLFASWRAEFLSSQPLMCKVDQALGSFFKIGNLIALRELALGYHYCMLN